MTEAQNPMIRLMQAVRYALNSGGSRRDIEELVNAVFDEPEYRWAHTQKIEEEAS
jgi:hypothetical protein